jgi:hypothetical protein
MTIPAFWQRLADDEPRRRGGAPTVQPRRASHAPPARGLRDFEKKLGRTRLWP